MTRLPQRDPKMNVTYENPAYDTRNPFITLNRDDNDYDTDSDDDDGGFRNDDGGFRNNGGVVNLDGDGRTEAYTTDGPPDYFHGPLSEDQMDEFNLGYTGVIDGPHREMAIDCPSDFVPSKKGHPRLHANHRNSGSSSPSTPARMNNKNDGQLEERVKKYQADLKKRREFEEKQMNEEEFLRTSLRGSKKLQALEQNRKTMAPIGLENEGFIEDDGDSLILGSLDGSMRDSLRAAVTHEEPQPVFRDPRKEQAFSVERLIVSFNNVRGKLQSEDQNQVDFLNQFFQNPRLQLSVAIHERVVETTNPDCLTVPLCHDSRARCQDAYSSLPLSEDRYLKELRAILTKVEFQSLLFTHDRIACQYSRPCDEDEFLPEVEFEEVPPEVANHVAEHVVDIEREVSEMAVDVPAGFEAQSRFQDGDVRIVRLVKSTEPLGATVRNDGDAVVVARIVKGGLAEQSGLLNEGDEILEVNGQEIRGLNVNDVSDMLASMSGQLTFCIVPARQQEKPQSSDVMVHVRALFNYDPEDDMYIPCRELGLSFGKCDILHVINQDDVNWWQAYREGEESENQLAGLIPSKNFQEQREAMKQVIAQEEEKDGKKSGVCCKKKKKKKQVMYNAQNDEFDAESILTYEEVALYYPQPNRKRPIVLIGPPNVGRQELRQRLMESDSNRFAAAVPHTSRPRKDGEQDGQDYHFIPRQVFEADILQNKFIEHGEYEHNLYGTSIAAVQMVIDAGKVCILNVHPQSLKVLKASKLKPYVIFMAPPNLEKLRMNCHQQGVKVSEDGLKEIITKGREIEEDFGHYFDYYVVNYDIDRTFDEILSEINRLDMEPQWVPAHWMFD